MKKIPFLTCVFCAIIGLALASCGQPEPTPKPEPEVSNIIVGDVSVIPAEGGTFEVDVQYNTDFTVEVESSAQSWITFVETKSLTSGKLVFRFEPNESLNTRKGVVRVKDKAGKITSVKLTFIQDEKKGVSLEKPTDVPFEGGNVYINVRYNTDYSVEVEESAADWIQVIRTKTLSYGQIELYVSPNDGYERVGNITVTGQGGVMDPIVVTIVQEANKLKRVRDILTELYNTMDGPSWTQNEGWGTAADLNDWAGVSYNAQSSTLSMSFNGFGLKGELPASFGEIGDLLYFLSFKNEPGITGTIPESFSKLTRLHRLEIVGTSMTSLRDCFAGMVGLDFIMIENNLNMSGPLPESVADLPRMNTLVIVNNAFTGTIPSSWARLGGTLTKMDLFCVANNNLSGAIPQFILDAASSDPQWLMLSLNQKGEGFDISNIDIPAYGEEVLKGQIEDINGKLFTFDEVISKNKYTVNLIWASWCPFSKALMPQIKDYYEIYRQDGLELIATSQIGGVDENNVAHILADREEFKAEVLEKGYGQWYNYYWPDYGSGHLLSTPNAEVFDQNGNVVFSSIKDYHDPVRDRFGKTASTDLIPFLETLFGPAEPADQYASSDYSQDGKILTLQTASVGNGINIVFMGDAYTDRDMAPGGLYETLMNQAMEEFFAEEPYKTFRNRFNVYAVKVVSKNGRIGADYETALKTSFGNRTEVSGNTDKCYEYALRVPAITNLNNLLVCVMINTRRNAGTAHMDISKQSSVAFVTAFGNDPSLFGSVLCHEAGGHGFAFLADEYYELNQTAPASHIEYYNSLYNQYGWFSNVDFTNDPSAIRWSSFLSDARYKGQVGIFEGGALYAKGVWRPTANSMMNMSMDGFNAPSRWAIYKRIMELSGENYSFETFLEYDAVNRKAAASQTSVRPPLKEAAIREPGAPPVIVP